MNESMTGHRLHFKNNHDNNSIAPIRPILQEQQAKPLNDTLIHFGIVADGPVANSLIFPFKLKQACTLEHVLPAVIMHLPSSPISWHPSQATLSHSVADPTLRHRSDEPHAGATEAGLNLSTDPLTQEHLTEASVRLPRLLVESTTHSARMVKRPRSSPPSSGLQFAITGMGASPTRGDPGIALIISKFARLLLALAPSDRTEHGLGHNGQELVMKTFGNGSAKEKKTERSTA